MVPAEFCSHIPRLWCVEQPFKWDFYLKYYVHGNNTHAFIRGYLQPWELEIMTYKNWWRSNKLEYNYNPYGDVPTSRNWILNEVNFFQLLWTLMILLGIWNSPSEAATIWADNK